MQPAEQVRGTNPFGTVVLVLAGLFCLFTTWSAAVDPRKFAAPLGFALTSPEGYNEILAQYAGFFLASGAICIAALARAVSRRSAFLLLAVIFGGLWGGRLVSLALNGGFGGYGRTMRGLYIIDGVGLILALTAMALDRRAQRGRDC